MNININIITIKYINSIFVTYFIKIKRYLTLLIFFFSWKKLFRIFSGYMKKGGLDKYSTCWCTLRHKTLLCLQMPEVTNDATCSYLDCGAVRHEPAGARGVSLTWRPSAIGIAWVVGFVRVIRTFGTRAHVYHVHIYIYFMRWISEWGREEKSQKWEREALGKGITAARGPFSTLTNRVVSLT